MPDVLESHVGDALLLGDGGHFLGDVLLASAGHVDIVTFAGGVVARDGLAEVGGAVRA